MIITQQTTHGIVMLLLFSLLAGIVFSFLYVVMRSLFAAVAARSYARQSFRSFRSNFNACYNCNKFWIALCDAFVCTLSACAICSICFVFNSGNFRLAIVPMLLLGLIVNRYLSLCFGKWIVSLAAFVLIKFVYITSFPFAWLAKKLLGLVRNIVRRVSHRKRILIMKKYTKEQIDRLDELTQFALLDQYYKDMMK